jgi:hypothetical protein
MTRLTTLLTLLTALSGTILALAGPEPSLNTSVALSVDADGRQVYVFNTQLRGSDEPGSGLGGLPAWGHLQLKLTELETGEFMPAWKGQLVNPAGETFRLGAVFAAPGDGGLPVPGDEIPGTGTEPVLEFFGGAEASCDVIEFESGELGAEDYLPAEVGLAAIINPDILVAILFTTNATAVLGRFGPSTPEPKNHPMRRVGRSRS